MRSNPRIYALVLSSAWILGGLFWSAPLSASVKILVPTHPFTAGFERELEHQLQIFNQTHPDQPVELQRRSGDQSTLREAVAARMAGQQIDIAAIEPSEVAALGRIGGLKALDSAWASKLANTQPKSWRAFGTLPTGERLAFPLLIHIPVLVYDQEILFRFGKETLPLPVTLTDLNRLLKEIEAQPPETPGEVRFATSWTGSRGLWFLEALSGLPLWERAADGVRAPQKLASTALFLRSWSSPTHRTQPDSTYEASVEAFLRRKARTLWTSSEALPHLERQTLFRWAAVPALPENFANTSAPMVASGLVLAMMNDRPATRAVLEFLYRPAVLTALQASAGSVLTFSPPAPPRERGGTRFQRVTTLAVWSYRSSLRTRTQDPDLLRLRGEWLKSLPSFLGIGAPTASDPEAFLTQLDQRLNAAGP